MLQIFTWSQIETPNIFTCSIKALRFPFLSAPPAKRFCPAPPSRSSQKHKSPRSRQVRRWKIGGSCVMLKDTSAGFWRAWWMWMSRSKSHNMRRGNARSLLSFSTKWPMETKGCRSISLCLARTKTACLSTTMPSASSPGTCGGTAMRLLTGNAI